MEMKPAQPEHFHLTTSPPDGRRFLMIKENEQTEEASAPTQLIIVLNWFEELKRLELTGE